MIFQQITNSNFKILNRYWLVLTSIVVEVIEYVFMQSHNRAVEYNVGECLMLAHKRKYECFKTNKLGN